MFSLLSLSCSENPFSSDEGMVAACEPPEDSINVIINPNGSSELALLMRDMYDEAEKIKQQIADSQQVEMTLDYEKILSAHATDPKTAASTEFKAFGDAYLQTIESLRSAAPSEAQEHYDRMVNNCMNCHKAMCPGPIVKIKKLL